MKKSEETIDSLRIEINRLKTFIGQDRRRMANELKTFGLTNANIAKVLNVHESTVRRMLKADS